MQCDFCNPCKNRLLKCIVVQQKQQYHTTCARCLVGRIYRVGRPDAVRGRSLATPGLEDLFRKLGSLC